MSFLNYGSTKALAYRNDFNSDIDRLYKREAYKSQVEAEKEQKTRYYASLMKEHAATSPWATKQLETKYKDLNNRIADFAINNPNFETDVNKMQEFMSLTDEYLNNDIVRKDIQSQQQFELFKQAVNKGEISEKTQMEEMEKYDSWMQNGGDGYVFSNIKLPKYTDIVQNSKKTFLQSETYEKAGNIWQNRKYYSKGQVATRALQDIQDDEYGKVIEQEYEKFNESNPGFYKSALEFHRASLNMDSFVEKNFLAFDPEYKATTEAKQKAQQEMNDLHPFWVGEIGMNFKRGATIKGNDAFAHLTDFGGVNKPLDLGLKGKMVKIFDEKTKEFTDVQLNGVLTVRNTPEMKVTDAGETYIKCIVETKVGNTQIGGGQNMLHSIDGDIPLSNQTGIKPYFTKQGIDLTDKQFRKLTNGHSVNINGTEYTFGIVKGEDAIKKYTDAGFTAQGTEGLSSNMKGSPNNMVYSGTVWMPANFTTNAINNYEDEKGGQLHGNKVYQSGMTQTKSMFDQAINEGNIDLATEILLDSDDWNKQDDYLIEKNIRQDSNGQRFRYTFNPQTGETNKIIIQ
jgi:hypothetical protein